MASFKISADKSRYASGLLDAAFGADPLDDTTAADSLTVDAGAYLVASGAGGKGAYLDNTGAWRVVVNGTIVSSQDTGIFLDAGIAAASALTIGVEGQVSGFTGIYAQSGLSISNSGTIYGSDTAIRLSSANAHTITNSKTGVIQGSKSIVDEAGTANDKITNAGNIFGDLFLADGSNSITNSGRIGGLVFSGIGNDVVTNSGLLEQHIDLGAGNNRLTNTGVTQTIAAGGGNDTATNTATMGAIDLGDGNNSFTNSKSAAQFKSGLGDDIFKNSGFVGSGLPGNTVDMGDGNDKVTNTGSIMGITDLGGGNNTIANSGKGLMSGITMLSGDDIVTNSATIDGELKFGDGSNRLTNSGAIFEVFFGSGDDHITNTGTIGSLSLGAGNDTYIGSAKLDDVTDSIGSDTIKLGAGDDIYFAIGAGAGDFDYIDGGTGADSYFMSGSSKALTINLEAKEQSFSALGLGPIAKNSATGSTVGSDTVIGFENVTGGSAADKIFGNLVANKLDGFIGNDDLLGFAGNDFLFGGQGADRLVGGIGADTLVGNDDADIDTFVYTDVKDSGVTKATRDFVLYGSQDIVSLEAIDANSKNGTASNDEFIWIGTHVAFNGVAGELRAYWSANGQIIEGDVNGDKKADFSLEISDLSHVFTLTGANFDL